MTKSGKTLWQKEKLLVLSNFFFCHYVFKKPAAAEASESVYMRERVNPFPDTEAVWRLAADNFWKHCHKRRNCSWLAIYPLLTMILPGCFHGHLLQIYFMWERVNHYESCAHVFNPVYPFPHTTILQQTTLNIFCQKISIIKWITYD